MRADWLTRLLGHALACATVWWPCLAAADENRLQRDLETLRQHYEMSQPERRGDSGLELQLRDRRGWRKLRVGTSEAEVEKLLGKPDRIGDVNSMTQWHYDREHDKGRVGFARDSRTVLEWRYF